MQTRSPDLTLDVLLLLTTYFDFPTLLNIRLITRSFNDVILFSLFRNQSAQAYTLQDALLKHWVYHEQSPNLTIEELHQYAAYSNNPSIDSQLHTLLLLNKKLSKPVFLPDHHFQSLKKFYTQFKKELTRQNILSDIKKHNIHRLNQLLPFLSSAQRNEIADIPLTLTIDYEEESIIHFWDNIFSLNIIDMNQLSVINTWSLINKSTDKRIIHLTLETSKINALFDRLNFNIPLTLKTEILTLTICLHYFSKVDDARKNIFLNYLHNALYSLEERKIFAQKILIHLLSNNLISSSLNFMHACTLVHAPNASKILPHIKLPKIAATELQNAKTILTLLLPYHQNPSASFYKLNLTELSHYFIIYLKAMPTKDYPAALKHLLTQFPNDELMSQYDALTTKIVKGGCQKDLKPLTDFIYSVLKKLSQSMPPHNIDVIKKINASLRALSHLLPALHKKERKKFKSLIPTLLKPFNHETLSMEYIVNFVVEMDSDTFNYLNIIKHLYGESLTKKRWKTIKASILKFKKDNQFMAIMLASYLFIIPPNKHYHANAIFDLIKPLLDETNNLSSVLQEMLYRICKSINPPLSQKLFEYFLQNFNENKKYKTSMMLTLIDNFDISNANLYPNLAFFKKKPTSQQYLFFIRFIEKLLEKQLIPNQSLHFFISTLLINFRRASTENKEKSFLLLEKIRENKPVVSQYVFRYINNRHSTSNPELAKYILRWLDTLTEMYLKKDRMFLINILHNELMVETADQRILITANLIEKIFPALKSEECLLFVSPIRHLLFSRNYHQSTAGLKLIRLMITRFKQDTSIILINALLQQHESDKHLTVLAKFLYAYPLKKEILPAIEHKPMLIHFIKELSDQTKSNMKAYLTQGSKFFSTRTQPNASVQNHAEKKSTQLEKFIPTLRF